MPKLSLNSCTVKSLHLGYMCPELPDALLTPDKSRARERSECKYWDYKERLPLDDAYQIAELAKDVIAFRNTDGGIIIVGITDDYATRGIPGPDKFDAKHLKDKIRKYVGDEIGLFVHSIELAGERFVWLIFVQKHSDGPQSMLRNGPQGRGNRPVFVKGDFFYRDGDEVKRCQSDDDIERVFRGFSAEHLAAYTYEIDQPYFRLLNPNYEHFVGRRSLVSDVKGALALRQPIVALDGLGGVGKTAVAIQVARELYDSQEYYFIISLSAKSHMWLGHVSPRRAAFAGLHSLMSEIASVFPDIPYSDDTQQLKDSIISFMQDVNGLILIDNLEEIDDPGVLKFLGREIPHPVKVLLTSRVDKRIGALTLSVPAMTTDEGSELLQNELERLGYEISSSDKGYFEEILSATGGVPLAIKWAAQIMSERRSARLASSILRGAGSNKQEFLSFCFNTMYDALTDNAKSVAKLIHYLDSEWKPTTLTIALDLPTEAVKSAIGEISDRGIIYHLEAGGADAFGVLPLTREYLANKWNENEEFKRQVLDRIADAFSSDQSNGFLLDWTEDRRAEFLAQRAEEKAKTGNYTSALRFIRLALTWQSNPALHFLEGKFLYQQGSKPAGLAHMRRAVAGDSDHTLLQGEDYFFFANALVTDASRASEKDAIAAVLIGCQKTESITCEIFDKFFECCMHRKEYRPVNTLLGRLALESLALVIERTERNFADSSLTYVCHLSLINALERLCASTVLDEDKRRSYADWLVELRKHYNVH